MARPIQRIPAAQAPSIQDQLGQLTQDLANNPNVARFSVQVDNRTGVINANVQGANGTVQHQQWIAPGLSATTRFDPNHLTMEQRNSAVFALLDQGLTQTDVAKRIGISQSRVAQLNRGRQQGDAS